MLPTARHRQPCAPCERANPTGDYFIAPNPGGAYVLTMKVAIHLTRDEEARALPILLRHSPGMILPQGTYVLAEDALKALRKAGIRFTELSREAAAPRLEEVAGERV